MGKLPESIFNFCRRYLILALPTKRNLKTWNMSPSDMCSLCEEKPETLHHIVSNCKTSTEESRYTWRHNSVLYTIVSHLSSLVQENCVLCVDIEGYKNPSVLFNNIRPDIVLVIGNVYHVIKLTVYFEMNLLKSHNYKMNKYSNINSEVVDKNAICKLYPIEFSCLGLTTQKSTTVFPNYFEIII